MKTIIVETTVTASPEKVWDYWNSAQHISKWAFASDDWSAEPVKNDLREGGKFLTRMAAKDGSTGFDFSGTYTKVIPHETIAYTLDDGRVVTIDFKDEGHGDVHIVQEFEMESQNSEEVQRGGWQAFLDNFKKHVEQN